MSEPAILFNSVELYKNGWGLLKQVWKPMLKVVLVYFLIEILAQASLDFVEKQDSMLLQLLISGVSLILSVILQSGITAVSLRLVRDKTAEISDLFAQKQIWVNYFLAMLAYQLIILLGLILFIVPGIYWALKYSLVLYLIVDKKVGVSEAFSLSGKMTQGILWKLIGFGLLSVLLNLGGLLALGVGVFVTMGITVLAYVLLYEQLLTRIQSNPAVAAVPMTSATPPTVPQSETLPTPTEPPTVKL